MHGDPQLVSALRRGERAAADHLVAAYGDRAYRLAVRITGNIHDAEEVVQDALWTVVRKIDSFRAESSFGAWFYRIVANAAYQKLRGGRARRRDVSFDAAERSLDDTASHDWPGPDWSARVDDPALQTELRLVLSAALDELPAEYRTVVILRDVEGLSNDEIGQVLRIGVANVKSRVHRARLFLRKRLGAYLAPWSGARRRKANATVAVPAACGF